MAFTSLFMGLNARGILGPEGEMQRPWYAMVLQRCEEAMRDHWRMCAMTMAGRLSPLGLPSLWRLFRRPEP